METWNSNYTPCHLPLSIILFAYVWDKWDYWCWTVTLQALRDEKAIKCCYCSSSASQTNKPALFRQESIYLMQSHGARTGAEQGILSLSLSLSFSHPPFLFFSVYPPSLSSYSLTEPHMKEYAKEISIHLLISHPSEWCSATACSPWLPVDLQHSITCMVHKCTCAIILQAK